MLKYVLGLFGIGQRNGYETQKLSSIDNPGPVLDPEFDRARWGLKNRFGCPYVGDSPRRADETSRRLEYPKHLSRQIGEAGIDFIALGKLMTPWTRCAKLGSSEMHPAFRYDGEFSGIPDREYYRGVVPANPGERRCGLAEHCSLKKDKELESDKILPKRLRGESV